MSIGQELRQNVGDGLRGLRYLVRVLGSDAERPKFAPPALPEALPELDTLMGGAFRTVGKVMCAVETAASPLRQTSAGFRGFASLETYFAPDGADAFSDDLYRGLKAVSAGKNANQLILKARLGDIRRDLRTRYPAASAPEKVCAGLLLSLVKFNPIVGGEEADVLKQYTALTLLFGISTAGRIPRHEVNLIVHDALLLASTRMEQVSGALAAGSHDDLAMILARLMNHLA
jgi:hypothetical protein